MKMAKTLLNFTKDTTCILRRKLMRDTASTSLYSVLKPLFTDGRNAQVFFVKAIEKKISEQKLKLKMKLYWQFNYLISIKMCIVAGIKEC